MNEQAAALLADLIREQRPFRIKLLGDSITHGVGGTGFQQNGAHIAAEFSRNPGGYCWAKKFKETLEARYPCTVTNNACTGTRIEFILDHFDELVEEGDDLILCTIGTNNRHQYFHEGPKCSREELITRFYANILALQDRFNAAGKKFIFVANIPATIENEKDGPDYWRILHMNDIVALYKKAQAVCGFPLISLYDRFNEYCTLHNQPLDTLLCDGLHPNDEGYDVMFALIMEELGLQ